MVGSAEAQTGVTWNKNSPRLSGTAAEDPPVRLVILAIGSAGGQVVGVSDASNQISVAVVRKSIMAKVSDSADSAISLYRPPTPRSSPACAASVFVPSVGQGARGGATLVEGVLVSDQTVSTDSMTHAAVLALRSYNKRICRIPWPMET